MLKKILAAVVAMTILFGVSAQTGMAAPSGGAYHEAVSIWPMAENKGYWYTSEYSYDGYGMQNHLETDSRKLISYTLDNNVFRGSMSAFSPGKTGYLWFNFTNGGEIIDLSEDNYFYYDFTAQDVMWMLTVRVGLDGEYAYDVDIPLQKLICEEEKTANLIDKNQYGVRGIYQGRIDLNKAIEESGNNLFHDIDLKNQKIHLISGSMTYFQCFEQDVLEIRYLGMGSGNKSFAPQTEPLQCVEIPYEAKNVAYKGTFQQGEELINLLDANLEWKTQISPTENGAVGGETAYLTLDTTEGFKIQASEQSLKDKAYIKGAVVGWPQLTCEIPSVESHFADNTYLVYDFKTETAWDVLLTFNSWFKVSLVDVLNGLTDENTLENLQIANGVRGYGNPGEYKGVLDLEEILNYYVGNLEQPVVSNRQIRLTNVSIIYENSEDSDTSYINTFNTLAIVRQDTSGEIDDIMDTEELTTGVYKPEGYEAPVYPEAEPMANSANSAAETNENVSTDMIILIAAGAAAVALATVTIVLVVKSKRKRGSTHEE